MADFTVVSEKGRIIMTQEKGLEKMKAKSGFTNFNPTRGKGAKKASDLKEEIRKSNVEKFIEKHSGMSFFYYTIDSKEKTITIDFIICNTRPLVDIAVISGKSNVARAYGSYLGNRFCFFQTVLMFKLKT